jgi:hypothetical protein
LKCIRHLDANVIVGGVEAQEVEVKLKKLKDTQLV